MLASSICFAALCGSLARAAAPAEPATTPSAPQVSPEEGLALPPVASDVGEDLATPEARLQDAIDTYLSGDLQAAERALVLIAGDPETQSHPEVLQEARVYLGEVLFFTGDLDGMRSVFLTVLSEDPDYRLDSFEHPPDVQARFELTRDEARRLAQRPPAPVPVVAAPPPNPLLVLMPGGLQFYNDQDLVGYAVLATVGGLAATTGGLSLRLRSYDIDPDSFGIQIDDDEQWKIDAAHQLKAWGQVAGWSAMAVWVGAITQGAVRSARDRRGQRVAVTEEGVTLRW